jgi:threonine dehydrogenase-like Zn-dependent dehydrogenase
VVIGAGGIGSFVIAAAAALGAAPLVAVDIDDSRLATATVLGATATVHSGRSDSLASVKDAVGTDGAHVVIEASGAPASPAAALSMVRRGGDVVVVGLQAAPVPVDLFSVSVREIGVHGTLAHVCGEDLDQAIAVLAGGQLAQTVLGDVIGLPDLVESGLRPLAERKAHGKIVVDVRGSV